MMWASRYVGIPYSRCHDGGGLACWGLVRLVLRAEAGVEVPAYAEVSAADLTAIARQIETDAGDLSVWRPVVPQMGQHYRAFDVAVMRGWLRDHDGIRRRGIAHVGILTGPSMMLHCDTPHDAVEVPLMHPTVRHRIVQVYRHRELDR